MDWRHVPRTACFVVLCCGLLGGCVTVREQAVQLHTTANHCSASDAQQVSVHWVTEEVVETSGCGARDLYRCPQVPGLLQTRQCQGVAMASEPPKPRPTTTAERMLPEG